MALQAQTKPKLVCINSNCKWDGHTIKNCYWKGGRKEGQFPPNFRNRDKMMKTPSTETPTPMTPLIAKVATSNAQPQPHITYALLAITSSTDGWEVVKQTGGATDHSFVNKNDFCEYEELAKLIDGHTEPKGTLFQVTGREMV